VIQGLIGSEMELVGMLETGGLEAMAAAGDEYLDPAMRVRFVGRTGPEVEYEGPQGLVEGWRDWLEPWASYVLRMDELVEVDDAVVALVSVRAKTRHDSVEMEHAPAGVFTFANGLVTGAAFYLERDAALEAARRGSG
jgi:hypothetical protein